MRGATVLAMAERSLRADAVLVGWGALTFAALLASFTSFRPVRDALVLDGNPDEIPWLFIGTFVAGLVASPLWSRFLAKRQKRRVVPIAFHVFGACLLVFAALVNSDSVDHVVVGRAFYIWSSIFNLFVVSVFWSLLADLIGHQKAKSLFGPIAAGGTIGGFVAPLVTKLLVAHVDVAGILVLSVVWLELAVVGVMQLRRHGEAFVTKIVDEPTPSTAFTGLERVSRSYYLLGIVGYVMCTATAATFLYMEQAGIVKEAFEHLAKDAARVARTDFFASLDVWTAGVTFVVQTLFARALLKWLGPGVVLCILPIIQLSAITMLSTSASLTTLAIVMVATRASTHGITRPAREVLFTVVDRDDKYHAKNVIDTIIYRFGDMVASWTHKGLLALAAGSTALVLAAVPLTVGWIALAIGLGVGFRRRTKDEPPRADRA
jgi:AAA family ATP:ADP antiporter